MSSKKPQYEKDQEFLTMVKNKVAKRGAKALCDNDVERLLKLAEADIYRRYSDAQEPERW